MNIWKLIHGWFSKKEKYNPLDDAIADGTSVRINKITSKNIAARYKGRKGVIESKFYDNVSLILIYAIRVPNRQRALFMTSDNFKVIE